MFWVLCGEQKRESSHELKQSSGCLIRVPFGRRVFQTDSLVGVTFMHDTLLKSPSLTYDTLFISLSPSITEVSLVHRTALKPPLSPEIR